jgi:hypothetical protein
LNFKFKPLFPISSPLEDEGSPSSTQPTIVSSTNISPSQVASNLAYEYLFNHIPPKRWKLYERSKKFKDAWTTRLPWAESIIGENQMCSKSNAKFAQLSEGRENC